MFARLIEALLALGVGYVVLRGRSPFPVLAGLLLSAILGSFIALSQVVGAEAMFGNLVPSTELAARITGAFDDPNYFGSYLAAMSALAIGCRLEARGRLVRATLLGIIALLSVTLLFTQSRGALVAFMAGLVVIAFTRSRRAGLLTIVGHRPGRGGGLPGVQRVALRGGRPQQRDGYGRSRRGVAGGVHVFTTSPLFGIGFGRFQEEASVGIAAHNWYVQLPGRDRRGRLRPVVALLPCRGPGPAPSAPPGTHDRLLRPGRVDGGGPDPRAPTAFTVTGPVLMALAAAVAADWPSTRRAPSAASVRVSPYPRITRIARPQVPATVGRRPGLENRAGAGRAGA